MIVIIISRRKRNGENKFRLLSMALATDDFLSYQSNKGTNVLKEFIITIVIN